eukprot:CAMPEP_0206447754 /NCGR_PEP_ID=MMETSP0324_2-20121206/17017_1 /ASSEMBLY_ACC=CAM_ASM_000836 /TAXON_ID=2866 /ORGANISM="Crypthecodinium cohnii, Strain Seligo" /LENGTH=75 /DNA_ID=CAMNT_0053916671 /DNA_START=118 /DNA_END=345 /DNA_ORIENTATION=-
MTPTLHRVHHMRVTSRWLQRQVQRGGGGGGGGEPEAEEESEEEDEEEEAEEDRKSHEARRGGPVDSCKRVKRRLS